MTGIKYFLLFLNENWTLLLVCLGVLLSILQKTADFLAKTDEEKIAAAKEQIRQTILKLISDAEEDYADWNKSGSVKRAQVISQIFEQYPILSKAIRQEDLIAFIDAQIDQALVTLQKIIQKE